MSHTSNWHNAIAHVDADCFYAACERMRHPELRHTPVCVLSSQDACVVAKTYDAKESGIKTGMPIWEAKKLLPNAAYLSADFRYYGQMSERMFTIFHRFSPDVEPYSIDEGFIDLNGVRSLWGKSFRALADQLRCAVASEIGITVSVGISTTKTLAKIASDCNKPDGSTVIPGRRSAQFLKKVPINDVPGLGRSRCALLHKFNIASAWDFTQLSRQRILRILGHSGAALWDELHGTVIYPMELDPAPPKSIARTASLGCVSNDRSMITAHLGYHTMKLVSALVAKRLTAASLTVFLRLRSFEPVARRVRITASNEWQELNNIVRGQLDILYDPHQEYRACGVVASRLAPDVGQMNLFTDNRHHQRQLSLIDTLSTINNRYGAGTLWPAAARKPKKTQSILRFKYPLLVAK